LARFRGYERGAQGRRERELPRYSPMWRTGEALERGGGMPDGEG
jgi:hypothetical protein